MKRFLALCCAVVLGVLAVSSAWAVSLRYDASEAKWSRLKDELIPGRSGNDLENDYYGVNCFLFVNWVLESEGRGSIRGYWLQNGAYLNGYNDKIVGQWLNRNHNYSGPSANDVRNIFSKAQAGDVVQMYWYDTVHTALVNGSDNNGVYFFQSHASGGTKRSITSNYYSWDKLSQLYSMNRTYGGFTIYRFGNTELKPDNPDNNGPEPPSGEINITTDSLSNWKAGDGKCKFRIYYEGDTATSANISSGSLPDGLNITCVNGQVHIEGTPTKNGTYTFTVRISSGSKSGEKTYSVNVSGITPPHDDTIYTMTTSLPNWKYGDGVYKTRIYYYGDTATSASISSGSLPDGLNITCVNGQVHIEGTPTKNGTYTFTVRIYIGSKYGEKTYSVNISGITTTTTTTPTPAPAPTSSWELSGNVLTVNGYKFTQQSSGTDKNFIITGLPKGSVINLPEGWVVDTDSRAVTLSNSSKSSPLADEYGVRISGACSITVNYDNIVFTAYQVKKLTGWKLSGDDLIIGNTYKGQKKIVNGDTYFIITGLPNASVISLPEGWTADTDSRAVTLSSNSKASSLADEYGVRISGPCDIMINYAGITLTARQAAQSTTENTPAEPAAPDKPDDTGSLEITTNSSLKAGRYMKSYRLTLKLKGADSPVWSIVDGYLPEGLTLNSETGKISGKPEEWSEDSFVFTVRAATSIGSTEKTFSLMVNPVKPRIKGTLPRGQANNGKEYVGVLTATGSKPMDWNIENLPAEFDYEINDEGDTCTITGYPEEEYRDRIKVTVTNAAGSVSKNVRLIIKPELPDICADDMPEGIVGRYYEAELDSPGNPKWSWSGRIPYGLTIDKATGKISGTPEMSGTFTFKVKARNSSGYDYEEFTIVISNNDNYTPDPIQQKNGSSKEGISDEYFVVAVLSEDLITFDESGQQDFEVNIDESIPSGLKLYYFAQSSNPSDDDEIVDFCSVSGEYIDNIPEDRIILVSPWFNAGVIYNPVIAVKVKDLMK